MLVIGRAHEVKLVKEKCCLLLGGKVEGLGAAEFLACFGKMGIIIPLYGFQTSLRSVCVRCRTDELVF